MYFVLPSIVSRFGIAWIQNKHLLEAFATKIANHIERIIDAVPASLLPTNCDCDMQLIANRRIRQVMREQFLQSAQLLVFKCDAKLASIKIKASNSIL